MTLSRICPRIYQRLVLTSALVCFSLHASTDNFAEQAQKTCQTLVAYRMGSLMDIRITEVKPLAVAHKWLVTGEIKKQTPSITFACLLRQNESKMELEKMELFQVKEKAK